MMKIVEPPCTVLTRCVTAWAMYLTSTPTAPTPLFFLLHHNMGMMRAENPFNMGTFSDPNTHIPAFHTDTCLWKTPYVKFARLYTL